MTEQNINQSRCVPFNLVPIGWVHVYTAQNSNTEHSYAEVAPTDMSVYFSSPAVQLAHQMHPHYAQSVQLAHQMHPHYAQSVQLAHQMHPQHAQSVQLAHQTHPQHAQSVQLARQMHPQQVLIQHAPFETQQLTQSQHAQFYYTPLQAIPHEAVTYSAVPNQAIRHQTLPQVVQPQTIPPQTIPPQTTAPQTTAPQTTAPQSVQSQIIAPQAISSRVILPVLNSNFKHPQKVSQHASTERGETCFIEQSAPVMPVQSLYHYYNDRDVAYYTTVQTVMPQEHDAPTQEYQESAEEYQPYTESQ